LKEVAPNVSIEEIQKSTDARLIISDRLCEMTL